MKYICTRVWDFLTELKEAASMCLPNQDFTTRDACYLDLINAQKSVGHSNEERSNLRMLQVVTKKELASMKVGVPSNSNRGG